MWMDDLWVIGLTGAAVGGAVGWPAFARGGWNGLRRGRPEVDPSNAAPMRLLGGLILMSGAAAGLIGVAHGAVVPRRLETLVGHVILASDLVFWALFTVWIRRASGLDTATRWSAALVALPLLVYAAFAASASHPPRFVWLLPAGSLASAYACLRWRAIPSSEDTVADRALLTHMVALGVALNAAQALRTFWPHVSWLREIVPLTMTIGLLSFATLAMRRLVLGARAGVEDTALPRYARSALDASAAAALLADLDRGMSEHKWYCDPDLSLAALADKLGVRPYHVSQALNQVRGRSLNDYLTTARVAEARRLLADPANDRFTIDAIAETAGFASRSAFYKAFKTVKGATPSELRRRQGRG